MMLMILLLLTPMMTMAMTMTMIMMQVTSCKIYIPVGHSEIDCAPRKWMTSKAFPSSVGPIDLPCCKCGTCTAVYYPENTLKLKRKEFRIGFDDPWNDSWVQFERETVIPGAWIVITAVSQQSHK